MLVKDWRVVDVILSRLLEGKYDAAMFPRRTYVRFPVLFDTPALDDLIQRWRAGMDRTFRAKGRSLSSISSALYSRRR